MTNSGSERFGRSSDDSEFGSLVLLKPRPYHKRGSTVRGLIAVALGRPYVAETVLDPTILLKSFIRFQMEAEPELDYLRRGVRRTAPSEAEIGIMRQGVATVQWLAGNVGTHSTPSFSLDRFLSICARLDMYLRSLARVDPYLVRVRDSHATSAGNGAQTTCDALINAFDKFVADMSGADLSSLRTVDPDTLSRIFWTNETRWPPLLADRVRSLSRKIAPGIYLIPGTPSTQ